MSAWGIMAKTIQLLSAFDKFESVMLMLRVYFEHYTARFFLVKILFILLFNFSGLHFLEHMNLFNVGHNVFWLYY